MALPIHATIANNNMFSMSSYYASPANLTQTIRSFSYSYNVAILLGKISDEIEIVAPLQINIEQEEGTVVVSDDIFLVYGDGSGQPDAVQDYIQSLIQYYRILERGAQTNPYDKIAFDRIQRYLHRRGPDAVQAERN